jgi:hypothetical protein
MGKKNGHVTVKNNDSRITLEFDTMFYVTAVRRELPPATKVEMPKKGKGSYNRKEKHKGRFHSENDGISFLYMNNI